jgi:very-short-patch-repair endonuclease
MAMTSFKARARALRQGQTSAEERLWQALRAHRLMGRKFRRQSPIGRYIADFVCLDARLVVEVDGATHSTAAELSYDARRTEDIERSGFHVLRVTNSDVYENLAGVLDAIWLALSHRENL